MAKGSKKFKMEPNKQYRRYFPPKQSYGKRLPKEDPQCQAATPEFMRIEIDQIFKEFLEDPDKVEYIFPSDLNNKQRKYIHHKAQKMNIISKSYGKEPNRQLHIKKRSKQLACQEFLIEPCSLTERYMEEFTITPNFQMEHNYNGTRSEKYFTGRLINGPALVPTLPKYNQEVAEIRMNLPIYDKRQMIIDSINKHQILVISSETGSGKTTQVPQYILEDMSRAKQPCKIICTQPRRISTISAAERVSYERGDSLGASVGYHIRLEQKYGVNTNLIYCTTGVFLRNLMCGPQGLKNITHIILDEIHERDKLTDFLLICLKQCLPSYSNLRIILMSATLNAEKFLSYFGSGTLLSVPGRLFAIDEIFLEHLLVLTKYMSPKMRQAKGKLLESKTTNALKKDEPADDQVEDPLVDEALDDYLNFSENYDYKIHYEEATAQLGMYFLSEGVSVDYQHSKTGRTALMIAASLGDKEFITRLCNMGANMDLADKLGKTAFDYALDRHEILNLLNYLKSIRSDGIENKTSEKDKEAIELLHLYDKTTSDEVIDYDLIATLIMFIHNSTEEGAILVFLPGYEEIMICNTRIEDANLQNGTYRIFLLHSSMNMKTQQDVFKKIHGQRKIILSTNIAETSITIDDVVFVIDTGKAKEKCYDSYNKVSSLQLMWISQACAKQRMGRAGRTQPGMCFRLYSKQRYASMEEERIPEILRCSLEELCLHTKILAPPGISIHMFLTMAPDPPSANSIKVAVENLQFLGALDKEEDLTKLGEYLAQLGIEPHLGKMMLFAVAFRCLDPVLTLVATLAHKDPFQLPPQANLKTHAAERRKELIDDIMSDHILYLQVFKKWQESCCNGRHISFCNQYYVSHPTMNSILETRSQLLGRLRSIGFVHQSNSVDKYNRHADCWPLVKAIICTGVYPNVAFPLGGYIATRSERKVNIQNSSACYDKKITTWLVYDELIKHRNHLLIRGVSAVSAMTIALMCGNDRIVPTPTTLNIDDWVEFEFPKPAYINFRLYMENLIKAVLDNPAHAYTTWDNLVVDTLSKVLDAEEAVADLKVPEYVGCRPKFFVPPNGALDVSSSESSLRKERSFGVRGRRGAVQRYPARNYRRSERNEASTSRSGNQTNAICDSVASLDISSCSSAPSERLLNGIAGSSRGRQPRAFYNNSWNNAFYDSHKQFSPERFQSSRYFSPDRFGDYPDNNIFVLIKPKQRKNVEIAQWTSKWIFAPQTEKKILYYSCLRKQVYLIFTVYNTRAFQGIATYVNIFNEPSGKPTAHIEWIFKVDLPHINIKHLRNPYNDNKPIYEGVDGQIIKEDVAEELVRIYQGAVDTVAIPSTSSARY